METIITAALSGFIGALAGGGVALVSQILNRKWQKQDLFFTARKQLYEEMASIAGSYLGKEKFDEISHNAARCMLVCSKELGQKIQKYMQLVESVNERMVDKDTIEKLPLTKEIITQITFAHIEMVDQMKIDLGYKK